MGEFLPNINHQFQIENLCRSKSQNIKIFILTLINLLNKSKGKSKFLIIPQSQNYLVLSVLEMNFLLTQIQHNVVSHEYPT